MKKIFALLIAMILTCMPVLAEEEIKPQPKWEKDGITIEADSFIIEPRELDGENKDAAVVTVKVTNDTKEVFKYHLMFFALEQNGEYASMPLDTFELDFEDVEPESEKEIELVFFTETSFQEDVMNLSYTFENFALPEWETYPEDMFAVMFGEMSEEEYMEKYKDMQTIVFELSKK